MRKQKGAALPSAIIFSTILLMVSIIIVSLVYQAAMINKINRTKDNNSLIYLRSHNEYSTNLNKSDISDTKFYWEDGRDGDIYALWCTNSSTSHDIRFYAIYDSSDNNKLLAYQESNIYIEERIVEGVTHYYLGGYVEIWGNEA